MRHKVVVIGLLFGLVWPVGLRAQTVLQSQSASNEQATERSEIQAELTEARRSGLQARCQAIATVIDNLAEQTSSLQTRHETVYDNVLNRLSSLRTELANAGTGQAAAVNNAIAQFSDMTDEAKTLVAAYVESLDALSQVSCDGDISALHDALEQAKLARFDFKQHVSELRNFITNELKPAVIAAESN